MKPILNVRTTTVLNITVRSKTKEYFTGAALAVSSKNHAGPFDILPQHTHFISLIEDGVVIRTLDEYNQPVPFLTGIMKVKDNQVEIYVGKEKIVS
jgi:F0F1-type ATP synthase epsilon subunit